MTAQGIISLLGVRTVMLQFSFSNKDCVPKEAWRGKGWATVQECAGRPVVQDGAKQDRISGVQLIHSMDAVGVATLPFDLEVHGYELVHAIYGNPKSNKGDRFHQVKFLFALKEHAHPSDEVVANREALRACVQTFCAQALWNARGFVNPLYIGEILVPHESNVNLAFTGRKPLFKGDGTPIVEWKRDEAREKVGEAAVPISARYDIRAVDGVVRRVSRDT